MIINVTFVYYMEVGQKVIWHFGVQILF